MGESTAPGWGAPVFAAASAVAAAGGGAMTGEGARAAGAATGTVTAAVTMRATRMRRSPFSTSISLRSVSAIKFASSRTRSGSKGLSLAMGLPLLPEELMLGGLRLTGPLDHHLVNRFQAEQVAHGPEATDHADGDGRYERAMAKALASMNIRNVDLDRRSSAAGDGIAQSDRGVGIGASVDDHAGSLRSCFLDPVHQLSLVVGLAERDRRPQGLGLLAHELLDVLQRRAAIDRGLSAAEEIEIGSVEDEDVGHRERSVP